LVQANDGGGGTRAFQEKLKEATARAHAAVAAHLAAQQGNA
jgi:hypothetical protein